MVAYVKAHRAGSSEPFEIAAPSVIPSDPAQGAEIVQPYIEAGATWWVEAINHLKKAIVPAHNRAYTG